MIKTLSSMEDVRRYLGKIYGDRELIATSPDPNMERKDLVRMEEITGKKYEWIYEGDRYFSVEEDTIYYDSNENMRLQVVADVAIQDFIYCLEEGYYNTDEVIYESEVVRISVVSRTKDAVVLEFTSRY